MSRKQRKKKAPRKTSPAQQIDVEMERSWSGSRPVDSGDLAAARQIRSSLEDIFQEQGEDGLLRFGQYVYAEWHKQLRGSRAAKMWKEMGDNDPSCGVALLYYDLLIRQMDWSFEPADESPEAQRWADFGVEVINDMETSWKDTVSELLSVVRYGYDVHEEVYKKRLGRVDDPSKRSLHTDGLIGLRKLAPRAQETNDGWFFDPDNGTVLGMFQQPPYGSRRLMMMNKCLHLRYRVENNNPEGRSMFRSAFTSYMAAKTLRWIEGVGFERNVGGMPIFEVPPELLASEDDKHKAMIASLFKIVRQMKRDEREGAVIPGEFTADGSPSGYKLRSFAAEGGSAMDFIHQAIVRYEQRMAMCFMTEFTLLGTESHGSYNMHSDKTSHLAMGINAIADIIETGMNSQTLRRLWDYNGVPEELRPRLKHGEADQRNIVELANALKSIFTTGLMTPTPADEDYVRRQMNLPMVNTDEGL